MARGFKSGGRKKGTLNKVAQCGDAHFHVKEYKKEPMVYILKANDRYKIGMTTNMELRFKRCVGLCPYPIEMIHVLYSEDYKEIEKGLHLIFKHKRIHYEWFLLSDEDVEHIKEVKSIDDLAHILLL